MKKILAILLALMLVLSVSLMMFSCGEDDTIDTDESDAGNTDGGDDDTDAPGTGDTDTPDNGDGDTDDDNDDDDGSTTPYDDVMEALNTAAPTSVTTVIATKRDGATLTARTTLNSVSNTVEYQVLNKLDLDMDTSTEMTRTETKTASNGENTISLGGMDFTAMTFVSFANDVATATVSDPSAFFGTTITTFTSANVTITVIAGVLVGMSVSYTTVSGSAVTLNATFS